MGILVRWAEILGKKIGDLQSPGARNAEGVRKFVCSVYKQYPDRFKYLPDISEAYLRGWMRSVCSDNLPPPPPQLPECIRMEQAWGTYKSAYDTEEDECTKTHYWRTTQIFPEGTVDNYIPIAQNGRWYLRSKTGESIPIGAANKTIYQNRSFGAVEIPPLPAVALSVPCTFAPNGSGGYDAQWTDSTYQNPLPAYCDSGGRRPVTEPPPVINKNYDINFSPEYNPSISFQIKPNIDNNFTFPLNLTANNIDVTVDFGGITINLPGGDPYPPSNNNDNNFPPEVTIRRPPAINNDNYEPVVPEEEPPPEGEEKKEEKGVDIAFIKVDIITPPVRGKTILQPNEEDNDYFAGYFNWLVNADGDYRLTQEPIRKKRQIFIPPDYVTGYSVYAVNGAKFRVTRFVTKKIQN